MPRIGGNPREKLSPFETIQTSKPEPENYMVDLSEGAEALPSTFELQDGDVFEANDNPEDALQTYTQNDNLAEYLPEDFLKTLGSQIAEDVERDILERQPWRDRFERGLEMMGLIESDLDDGAFPGASNVIHPLLAEAVTQFWARAFGEMMPPDGPVKCKVSGKQSEDMLKRAERISEYMNYEMMVDDEEYVANTSRLYWNLPFTGNCFRKTVRDTFRNKTVSMFVSVDDLIVPAEAVTLKSTPRFTHRMRKTKSEMKQLQASGFYRQVNLDVDQVREDDEVLNLKNEASDVEPDGEAKDNLYEIFETCLDLDIPGQEHVDDMGEETGLVRSYYVTVDRHTREVLSIYQGWKDNDERFERHVPFTKYGYVPGFGFYDFGLFHLIGGLQTAATGALRVLLDGAATASLSGGFVSKNANIKGETLIVSPGEWRPVDATSEDLRNAFFPIPVKDPSPSLFNLVGLLVEGGKSFVSTTEAMTGKGDGKNVAVGTISKLIEQGEKVISTIHRLCYRSFQHELKLRYELAQENIPEEGYPYDVDGEDRTVFKEDFAKGVTITPVADPNIFSSGQRLAIAQMVYETASANPDKVNRTKAIRRLYEAARVPDIDDLIPEEAEPQPYDPNGEIQAMLMGRPILVSPDQPHDQHLQVLWAFAANPQYGGNPDVQKQIGPTLLSTIGQHLAFAWVTHSRQLAGPQIGQMLGYMNPQSGELEQPQAPPEMIAQALAQIAPQMAQVPGMPSTENGDDKNNGEAEMMKAQIEAQAKQQDIALKQQEHQQKLAMKAEEHEFKKAELQAKTELKQAEMQMNMQIKQQSAVMDMEAKQREAEQKARMSEQQMAMDQQTMVQQAEMQQRQMSQQASMDQQKSSMEMQQMEREGQMKEAQASQNMQHQQQQAMRKSRLDHLRGPNGDHRGGA